MQIYYFVFTFAVCFLYFCEINEKDMSQNNRKRDITVGMRIWRAVVVLVSIALLVIFIPRGASTHYDFSIGKPWYDSPIIAKETFPLLKSDSLLNAELSNAKKSFKPIFEMNPQVKTTQISNFMKDFDASLGTSVPQEYKRFLIVKLAEVYEAGILSAKDYDGLKKQQSSAITISVKNEGREQPVKNLCTRKTAYERIMQEADSTHMQQSILRRCNIGNYLVENLTYDQTRSESLAASIERSVSKYKGEILAGQEIVHRGQIIDEDTYLALRSMEAFYSKTQKKTKDEQLCQIAGHVVYVALIVVCLLVFFTQFRPGYLRRGSTVLFITVMTLIFPLITYTLVKHVPSAYIAFVVPYCIVPIFVCVFMDSRTAYMMHLCSLLLSAVAVSYPFEFIITQCVAGLVAVYSMKQLSQRSELFSTVIFLTLASLLCYLGFDLINMSFFSTEGLDRVPYFLIVANGVLLLVSYLLLFPFEKMFHFTSNVTLIELSNTNNEILRRLAEEAPGTFQHSMQVANLAAEVANKVGANSQLVRTAALYHDIGKIKNPAFFTENQSGINPHDKLTFVHSARIIIAHVRDGLELAEKYKLPSAVSDFISTHHGTSKAKYFYISYMKKYPGETFDEAPFTYPGPNPSTVEQAILMMADAIEASSRSLKEYTEETINNLINSIIDSQVREGYFNECPITFASISQAKSVFREKLKTIYHTRISYPEMESKA